MATGTRASAAAQTTATAKVFTSQTPLMQLKIPMIVNACSVFDAWGNSVIVEIISAGAGRACALSSTTVCNAAARDLEFGQAIF